MNFTFGIAGELYRKNIHPRVYISEDELPRFQEILRSAPGKKILAAMRESVKRQTTQAQKNTAKVGEPPALIGDSFTLAFFAFIDEDKQALEVVRHNLAVAEEVENNPAPDQQARHRIGASQAGHLAMAYDLVYHHLERKERLAFFRWAYKSGVRKTLDALGPWYHHGSGANIPMNQLMNVIRILMSIDGDEGVPNLDKDWARALSMFEATLNTVVGPEGYPSEDMGYGTGMFSRVVQLADALRRGGFLDPYEVCPRYSEFGNAILHFVQPWGKNLSTTGDHGDDIGQRTFALARLAEETSDPTLLWLNGTLSYRVREVQLRKDVQTECSVFALLVADELGEGVHPAKMNPQPATHFRDNGRGIVSFRSGWKKDDTFVVFDGSQRCPAAAGHDHASCGHFSISAFGEYLAIDTGRYNMEQNCHNVVLVDGKSGRDTKGEWEFVKHPGILKSFSPGELVDVASVDSSHQHNCFWARRHIGLVKGRGVPAYLWVVDDINKNNDWGEYWWQLHTCPENTIQTFKSHATVTGWRQGNKMDVHFALPDKIEYPRPHRIFEITQDVKETSSYNYVGKVTKERMKMFSRPAEQIHYSTFHRPRLLAKIEGYNGRFMSFMLPRDKSMKPAKVKRLKSLPGSLAASITFERVEDTVIFAHEHNLLEAGGIKARGRWCVVRRNLKSGRVLEQAVGDGSFLE